MYLTFLLAFSLASISSSQLLQSAQNSTLKFDESKNQMLPPKSDIKTLDEIEEDEKEEAYDAGDDSDLFDDDDFVDDGLDDDQDNDDFDDDLALDEETESDMDDENW